MNVRVSLLGRGETEGFGLRWRDCCLKSLNRKKNLLKLNSSHIAKKKEEYSLKIKKIKLILIKILFLDFSHHHGSLYSINSGVRSHPF